MSDTRGMCICVLLPHKQTNTKGEDAPSKQAEGTVYWQMSRLPGCAVNGVVVGVGRSRREDVLTRSLWFAQKDPQAQNNKKTSTKQEDKKRRMVWYLVGVPLIILLLMHFYARTSAQQNVSHGYHRLLLNAIQFSNTDDSIFTLFEIQLFYAKQPGIDTATRIVSWFAVWLQHIFTRQLP